MLFLGNREAVTQTALLQLPVGWKQAFSNHWTAQLHSASLLIYCFALGVPASSAASHGEHQKEGQKLSQLSYLMAKHNFLITAHLPCILWILARWNHCGSKKSFWSPLGWFTLRSLLVHVVLFKSSSAWVTLHIWAIDTGGMSEWGSVCKPQTLKLKWDWKVKRGQREGRTW